MLIKLLCYLCCSFDGDFFVIPTSCRRHLVQSKKQNFLAQASLDRQIRFLLCGETGIRTPETLLEFTRFPGVPLQPLEHLSSRSCALKIKIGYKGTTKIAHMQIFLHFFRYFSPKSLFALVVVAAIICSTGQLNTSDRRSAT